MSSSLLDNKDNRVQRGYTDLIDRNELIEYVLF